MFENDISQQLWSMIYEDICNIRCSGWINIRVTDTFTILIFQKIGGYLAPFCLEAVVIIAIIFFPTKYIDRGA